MSKYKNKYVIVYIIGHCFVNQETTVKPEEWLWLGSRMQNGAFWGLCIIAIYMAAVTASCKETFLSDISSGNNMFFKLWGSAMVVEALEITHVIVVGGI